MKRPVFLLPALLLALALVIPARADVIWSPVDIAAELFLQVLPWLLVLAAVIVTLILVRKFRKK